jgi:hypothetical protein
VAIQRRFLNASSEVEDFEGRVIGSCDEFGVVRTEREVSYRIIVPLNDLDVVEIRLPVLDQAVVIS